ncbi:MAG: thioredoxin [Planctomycetaceae bacterium]|nr:thioredoxin [Planctomycetaceae bacterium]MCA9108985.1 thioredoxin [Planctomycetaceae bacterium]
MSDKVLELNDDNFQTTLSSTDQPVLVDFWAPWCGPCKMLAPTIDELADDYSGKVKIGKVNTDNSRQVAIDHQISAIPTLMLFKGGQVVERVSGLQPKAQLAALLDKHL